MELYQSKYTGEEMDALFDKANYVVGTYTGNGNASQFINLGFTPSAVIVMANNYVTTGWLGMAVSNYPALNSSSQKIIEIVPNGFNVFNGGSSSNAYTNSDQAIANPFRYIAFR